MSNFENRLFKYKLCLKIESGKKIKDICNQLINYGYYEEKYLYKKENNFNSYIILYNFYKSYKLFGIYSLIDFRGKHKNMNNKSRKIYSKSKEQERKELLEKLTKEQLLEIIEIQQDILGNKYSKEDLFKKIKDKKSKCSSLSISQLCFIMGISKSYFYKLNKKNEIIDNRKRKDEFEIKEIINDLYYKHKTNFGARRIHILLNTQFCKCISYKTVFKYMNELGLKATIRVSNKSRVDIKNTKVKIDNLLNRNFVNSHDNDTICTDVTFIKWNNKFLYLSAAIDLRNNEIVGWSLSERNDNKLVEETFSKINLCNFSMIHSDHGFQYSSNWFKEMIKDNNLIQSMSRIGNSLDNRPIEYWFSILKEESIRKAKINKMSFSEIYNYIHEFINYYNYERIQLNLKNLSPIEFRRQVL